MKIRLVKLKNIIPILKINHVQIQILPDIGTDQEVIS